jgi:hypothetical protein
VNTLNQTTGATNPKVCGRRGSSLKYSQTTPAEKAAGARSKDMGVVGKPSSLTGMNGKRACAGTGKSLTLVWSTRVQLPHQLLHGVIKPNELRGVVDPRVAS